MKAHLIRDPSAHSYFTMIPNIVTEMRVLSHAAVRLYLWYKKVCGETREGECFQSLSTIGNDCAMNRQTVVNSRRELEKFKLIKTEGSIQRDGSKQVTVTITDVWGRNKKRYDLGTEGVRSGDGGEYKSGTGIRPLINKIDMSEPDGSDGEELKPLDGRKRRRAVNTKFDLKAAEEFNKVVSSYIKVNRKSDMKAWANEFRLMREKDGVTKGEIREAIQWYGQHIGEDEFMVQAYSAGAFRIKWNNGQIPAAMVRTSSSSNNHPRGQLPVLTQDRMKTIAEIQRRLEEKFDWEGMSYGNPAMKDELEVVLKDMGLEPGSFKTLDI